MSFRCLDKKTNTIREVTWIYRKDAWVPVVVVCKYQLYPQSVQRSSNIIPDVSGLTLSLENLGLNISWTNNSSYDTEVSVSRDEEEWSTSIVETGNSFVYDVFPDDTLFVRVRFTNGSNYSVNYTTASISVWEIVDFNLYGLTEEGEEEFVGHTVYNLHFQDEFYQSKLKTFLNENINEDNHRIFSFNGLIYRIIQRYRENYIGYEFESIDPVTLEVTPINLSSNEFNCAIQAMCFDSVNQYAYIATQCGFYRLELNGVLTQLSSSNNDIKAMTFYNDQLLSLQNVSEGGEVSCRIIDTSNGTHSGPAYFAYPMISEYSISYARSLTTHNGNLYAIVSATNGVDYSGLILISTEINETIEHTFISRLTEPNRILGSIYLNEVPTLVIQQDTQQNSGLYYLSDEGVIDELIIDTKLCCNLEDYESIAFNPLDRHLYHLCMRLSDYDPDNLGGGEGNDPNDFLELSFEKLNPDTLQVTNIPLSGYKYSTGIPASTTSYIEDGGGDMFDNGNFISTNIKENGFVEYTHTQQSSQTFTEIADGTVEDGTNYFGSGSEYFTNLYNGLFVLVARDINITSFTISGELGADGSGTAAEDIISLNNGHKGYFKKVFNSGDPSVNHLIIIPNKSGVTSAISDYTNDDYHSIMNLSGIDYIYYLLFSSQNQGGEGNDNEITSEEARVIGNAFLSTINGGNMSASSILERLNENVNNITTNIPNMHSLVDEHDGSITRQIGAQPGLKQPHCITYYKDNNFLAVSDDGLFLVTSEGFVTRINSDFHWVECRGIAFVRDRLFAVYSQLTSLAEVNPETGELINNGENKKGPSILVSNGEETIYTYGIRGLASSGDSLFIIAYDDSGIWTLAVLNSLVPDESNLLYATRIMDTKIIGGITTEFFGRIQPPGQWFWSYDEETTGIIIPLNEEIFEINPEDLEVQWHEDNQADHSYSGWQTINIEEVVSEEGNLIVLIDKPSSNYKIRMRFVNPLSKWSYYDRD